MVKVFAMDPGPTASGWIHINYEAEAPFVARHSGNEEMLAILRHYPFEADTVLVLEGIEARGMPVGDDVFQTCQWIGRFSQVWEERRERGEPLGPFYLVFKNQMKHIVGGKRNIPTTEINRLLREEYGEKGTKKAPGLLYNVSGAHCWSALAVGTAWLYRYRDGKGVVDIPPGTRGARTSPRLSQGKSKGKEQD